MSDVLRTLRAAVTSAASMATLPNPLVIQGGMGVAVSNWRLAQAVSRRGQLGVVSGTGIDSVLVRRLQDGDVCGSVRRAMAHFPFPEVSQDALRRYFLPDGRSPGQPYARIPMWSVKGTTLGKGLNVLGSFCEVFLAREGHDRPVGLNLLTKVQLPNMTALYGAMLAGVNYVLMGAGIPRDIPGILDQLARHLPASMKIDVAGSGEAVMSTFDPAELGAGGLEPLHRPAFLPIIASHSLASILLKKGTGSIEGFVVEAPTAGGHNAPPRGVKTFDERGQPVYGERDVVDMQAMQDLGVPFWLAGGTGTPEGLRGALDVGAAGVQVGTAFAYCEESGLGAEYKQAILARVAEGDVEVFTDPRASPTGFPFKVVSLAGSNSEEELYQERRRVCDLGYLREVYRTPKDTLGYRCASEPVDDFVAKGGALEETVGRKCLCNALMVNVGLGQIQKHGVERPIITSGDDLAQLGRLLKPGVTTYTADDVLDHLLEGVMVREAEVVAA